MYGINISDKITKYVAVPAQTLLNKDAMTSARKTDGICIIAISNTICGGDFLFMLYMPLLPFKVRSNFSFLAETIGGSLHTEAKKVNKKLGRKIAEDWYKDYKNSDIKEIFIDKYTHNKIRDFFFKIKPKNISFVDCSSVVAMKRNKIGVIFSFDGHFKEMGVKLLGDVV